MRPKVGGGGGGGVAEREREGMGSLGRAVAEALGVDCSSEGMGGSWTVGRGGEEVVIRGAATWRSRGDRSWSSMLSAGGGLSRGPPGRRRGGVCEGRKKEGSQAGRRRQKRTTEATMRETPMRAMVGGAVGRCQCLAEVARLVNLFTDVGCAHKREGYSVIGCRSCWRVQHSAGLANSRRSLEDYNIGDCVSFGFMLQMLNSASRWGFRDRYDSKN